MSKTKLKNTKSQNILLLGGLFFFISFFINLFFTSYTKNLVFQYFNYIPPANFDNPTAQDLAFTLIGSGTSLTIVPLLVFIV